MTPPGSPRPGGAAVVAGLQGRQLLHRSAVYADRLEGLRHEEGDLSAVRGPEEVAGADRAFEVPPFQRRHRPYEDPVALRGDSVHRDVFSIGREAVVIEIPLSVWSPRKGQCVPQWCTGLIGRLTEVGHSEGDRRGYRDQRGGYPREPTSGRRRRYVPLLRPEGRIGQGPSEVRGRRKPVGRQVGEGLPNRCVHIGGHRRSLAGRGGNVAGEDLPQNRTRRGAGEGWLAHQHLVEHAAQRIDIGRRTDVGIAGRLLRAHVVWRAQTEPRLRETSAARRVDGQGDPEVGDNRISIDQQDVGRLDVPVDNALAVGVVEGFRDVDSDPDRLFDRKLAFPVQATPEALALHVRHGVEEKAVHLSGFEEREDVGVLQVCGRPDLGEEAVCSDDRGQLGLEDFEGDSSRVSLVEREVDRRHSPFTEPPLDVVLALEGRGQARQGVGHRANIVRLIAACAPAGGRVSWTIATKQVAQSDPRPFIEGPSKHMRP